jgi:DNA repair exonuclease SbcCD ATPase subunit
MIPQRIKLSGFLSYKDEQEIRFDESSLWMLSGANGTGKSSIFDAVTYALFGHHRGGSQSAAELINKESNTLSVEFDFCVDQQLYRVKRTVRRRASGVASTQQVMKYVKSQSLVTNGSEAPEDDWEAIPDTTYKTKFDAWIKEKIGLDYDTFTSSVLLLQGKSEKLLDSTPSGRASVLARIVDLERYQKLHGRADDRRRELKGQLEGLSSQLGAVREVTAEELAAADSRIEAVQGAQAEVNDRLERLITLELKAQRWADAVATLTAAKGKLSKAESLLSHAVAIEKDYTRLRELRDVLPAVGVIVTERGRIAESKRTTESLVRNREGKGERRRVCEHTLDQTKKKHAALRKTLAEDEARLAVLNARLRELAGVLEKVKQAEDADSEVRRLELELKTLPSDAEGAVRTLQQEQERLLLLTQHLALLERLHQDRSELTKVTAAAANARVEETRLLAAGKKAKDEFEVLQEKTKSVKEARGKAEEATAEARGLARQARELAEEFKKLTGAKTCHACGLPLTAEHLKNEKKKRDLDARAAERKLESLAAAAETARKDEEEAIAKEAAERERLDKLRDQYKDAAAALKQSALDIKRLTDSCRQSYFALPDEFKQKLGPREPEDWSNATFPDRKDITALSTQAHGLDGVKRKLASAQEEARKVQTLRTRLESARDRLSKAKQGLPAADPTAIRQEFAARQSEETTTNNSIKGAKREIESAEKEIERQQRELSTIDRELTELTGKLNLEESTRKQSAEAIDRARNGLPPGWQQHMETAGLKEHSNWKAEADELADKKIEAEYTHLQAARGGLDSLRAEIRQYEEEVAAFPPEAQRAPAEVKAQVLAAKKELELRTAELLDAQRDKSILEDYRRQRAELNERYKDVDLQLKRYKTLAELLGRDRLQRFLVRTAEKQIVEFANAVLDRLSGGQLFLKLVGSADGDGPTEKAFELECSNRVAGGAAINVSFLSGSQRFRVAVALALGIGQYASKQHRPIESVIIDEGFGCLDRSGRQVMIQELQNLRGHLQCILLVSHQEEFADAFSDGYRFELRDGSTKISRFVK